jgi:hypothetical protein
MFQVMKTRRNYWDGWINHLFAPRSPTEWRFGSPIVFRGWTYETEWAARIEMLAPAMWEH